MMHLRFPVEQDVLVQTLYHELVKNQIQVWKMVGTVHMKRSSLEWQYSYYEWTRDPQAMMVPMYVCGDK